MTSTQISFSAFAATQTDPGNFAVSDQSGQRGCFFPQPEYRLIDSTISMSGSAENFAYFGFEIFSTALDAPCWLPSGGHKGFSYRALVSGISSVPRA